MIFNMDSGASLNFFVCAYESEEALAAAAPGLNTIGVVTQVPFPGWHFDQAEPETAEEGLLWFKTGSPVTCDAAFSAVPGNPIMVYPLSAFQRQNGVWEEIPARSYLEKDGVAQWVTWIKQRVYMVQNGVLKMEFQTDDYDSTTVNQDDNTVTFHSTSNYGNAFVVLDLTHYSTLVIEGIKFSGHTSIKVGVWSMDKTPNTSNVTAGKSFASSSGRTEVDVSDLTGEFKVGLKLLGGASYDAVVTDFYLTRS